MGKKMDAGRPVTAADYERVRRTLVHKGKVVDYYVDTMRLPDGTLEDWDLLDHRGAAACVPVMDDGRILMVRQYRNALERMTLEIPAGGLRSREEPALSAAERELREETGCRATQMEHLLTLRTTVAFCNERIEIYLATGLVPGEQELDPDEFLNVEACTLDELREMIFSGRIEDSKTIAGIMAYADRCRTRDRGTEA